MKLQTLLESMNVGRNERVHVAMKPLTTITVSDYQSDGFKPKGFWYGVGPGWIDFISGMSSSWKGKYLYKIDVDTSSMKMIHSSQELINFNEENALNKSIGVTIDWKKVSSKYSGIEISPYLASMRMRFPWYYSWDVASGCVWKSSVVKNIKLITDKLTYD